MASIDTRAFSRPGSGSGSSSGSGSGPGQQAQETAVNRLRVIVIVFEVLSLLALVLRFIARRIKRNGVGWDDGFALLAGLLSVVNMANDLVIIQHGAGKSIMTVPYEDIAPFFLHIYIGQALYAPIIVSIKMAVLSLYLRLFDVKLALQRSVYAFMAVTVAWGFATFLPTIFQCTPVKGAWDLKYHNNCIDIRHFLLGTNVPDVLLDIGILIIPAPIILRLQLPTSKKVAIMCIFLLGAFDTAMAIVRLASLTKFGLEDPTLGFTEPLVWSTIEINVGIICACLPVMAPIFTRLFGKFLSNWNSRTGDSPSPSPGSNSHSNPHSPNHLLATPTHGFSASKPSAGSNRISIMSISSPRSGFQRLDEQPEKDMIEMKTSITVVHESV